MYSSLPSEGDKIILVSGVVLSSNSLNIVTHQYIIGSIFKNCWQKTTHKPQTDCSSLYGFDLLTQLCFTMYSLFRFVLMGFSWVSWCSYWSRSFGRTVLQRTAFPVTGLWSSALGTSLPVRNLKMYRWTSRQDHRGFHLPMFHYSLLFIYIAFRIFLLPNIPP